MKKLLALALAVLVLFPVDLAAQTPVVVRGKASTSNATSTPLANAAVFTGTFEDARDYPTLTVTVFADKASATDGLEVQWSSDSTNVDITDLYTITANVGRSWTTVTKARYFRVKYTNGAVTQTVFRLSAVLRQSGAPGYEAETGLTNAELRATPVPVSGTVASGQSGTWIMQPGNTANTTPWKVDGSSVTQPVSGTFWPATQPVSGPLTDAQIRATPVPVSGTFWPATQPVSGPLTDAQIRATPLPISGTVTGPATDAQIRATPVPISGAVTGPVTDTQLRATPVPVSGPLTDAQLRATPVPISGTVTGPLTDTQLRATAVPVSGPLTDPQIRATPLPVSGSVTVTPPTITKGTQGATGFTVQNLKDAGRTSISFYANNVASGTTTTETLITLVQSKGTAATSSATTYTPTSGKRFRIVALSVASRGHATATIQSTVFNLRLNTAGACIVTSTPILFAAQSATAAVASAWDRVPIPIPDGYEIAGDGTASICVSAAATFTTNAPTWSVNLIGFEY